jgi:cation diffusion facilitator family transporter
LFLLDAKIFISLNQLVKSVKSLLDKEENLAGFTALFLFSIGILQVFYGTFLSGSVALTANGIDCMGDAFVSSIVWVGLKFFRRPADHKFHFGYYKLENASSIVAAVVMVILALYIVYRSYQQLVDPHKIEAPIFGMVMAMFAAVVAFGLGYAKYKKAKQTHLGSVKLEAFNTVKDGGASLLAVIALLISYFGYPIADALVGFVIALVIVSIAFFAIKESSLILLDACDNVCIDRREVIKGIALSHKGVLKAKNIRLRKAGPIYHGTLELVVPENMTIKQLDALRKDIEGDVQRAIPQVQDLAITAHPPEDD